MNRYESFEPSEPLPLELAIQRCLDGALDEAAEQALLRRLESSDDGWRRLALGFVEERLWRSACRKEIDDPARRVAAVQPQQSEWRRSAPRVLAAALCLAVAFGAGRWTGGAPGDPRLASLPRPSASGESPAAVTPAAGPYADDGPVMYVSLRPTGEEGGSSLDVPVYDAEQVPAEWAAWEDPALPDQTVQLLRRAGYGVESRRDVWTLRAPDGGAIYLPVESVRVQPARY